MFICGSLESGKDGVGDYTKLLAMQLQLVNPNVEACIVAINDKYIGDNTNLLENHDNIEVLRLNASHSYELRSIILNQYAEKKRPNVVSLQFVPYAFHKKGIPYQLLYYLPKLKVSRWHIMFHELWIGMEKKDSYQLKLIGILQRRIIYFLIKKLKPIQIHTSNNLYAFYLSKLIDRKIINILPLFSNVNIFNISTLANPFSASTFNIVLFGSIHQLAPIEQFITWIKTELSSTKQTPLFTFLGNNGNHVNEWIKVLSEFQVNYQILSFQTENEIAKVLSHAQLGITTTPYYLADKSGTVAAMVQFNLPVLCVARSWTPNIPSSSLKQIRTDNCIKWDNTLILNEVLYSKPLSYDVSVVGKTFLDSID